MSMLSNKEDIDFSVYSKSDEEVNFELEGPDFLSLPEKISIKAGNNKDVILQSNAECGTNFEGDVKFFWRRLLDQ